MKTRHAAALALISWYLMLPPLLPSLGNGEPYLGLLPLVPLSQWTAVGSFNSKRECIDAHIKLLRNAIMKKDNDGLRIDQAYNARCVDSDDPRLKQR
jgi:hypothetical protein